MIETASIATAVIDTMPSELIIGLAILAGIVLAESLRRIAFGRGAAYIKRDELFTPAEKRFMAALQKATGGRYWIAAKVRVADALKVDRRRDDKTFWRAFTKISSKHFDYVICSPGDFKILAAIELDDRSHEKKERRKRDIFLDKACRQAGLPLLRFRVQRKYEPQQIQTEIDRVTHYPVSKAA